MLRIWSEQLRNFEELEQLEEFAVRALLRNLAVRALRVKHSTYEPTSLALPSWAYLQRPQQCQE